MVLIKMAKYFPILPNISNDLGSARYCLALPNIERLRKNLIIHHLIDNYGPHGPKVEIIYTIDK